MVELLAIRGIFSNEVKPIRAASDVIEEDILIGAIKTEAEIDTDMAAKINKHIKDVIIPEVRGLFS